MAIQDDLNAELERHRLAVSEIFARSAAPAAPSTPAPTPAPTSRLIPHQTNLAISSHTWGAQNANKPYSLVTLGNDYRFEVRASDPPVYMSAGSNRSELAGPRIPAGRTLEFRSRIKVEPGPVYRRDWLSLLQVHGDDSLGYGPLVCFHLQAERDGGVEYLRINTSFSGGGAQNWRYVRDRPPRRCPGSKLVHGRLLDHG